MFASPVAAFAVNLVATLLVLGVGVALFAAVNGSPRRWRGFLAREPNPAARIHHWRRRMQGYFGVFGATAGSGVASGGFLLTQRPDALGQIDAFDAGLSGAGLCVGLIAGLCLGAVAAVNLRLAPEPPAPDDD